MFIQTTHTLSLFILLQLVFSNASSAKTPAHWLQQAHKAYNELEFQQAIDSFNRYLATSPNNPKEKSQALTKLAICHYNLGEYEKAKQAWKQALLTEPSTQLPTGQSPAAVRFFNKEKSTLPLTTLHQPIAPKRTFWQRHKISTITFSVGIATAVAAGIVGGLAQNQSTPQTMSIAQYQTAQTYATTANTLWIASGVLAVGSMPIFLQEK